MASNFSIIQVDLSLISAYNESQRFLRYGAAQLKAFNREQAGKAATLPQDVVAPWDVPEEDSGDGEDKVRFSARDRQELFTSRPLVDKSDPLFRDRRLDETTRNLFAMYKALGKMRKLAEFAANDPSAKSLSARLEKQWDRYESELQDFIKSAKLEDVTVNFGRRKNSLKSTAMAPSGTAYFPIQRKITNVTDDIPGIGATDKFTMRITKGGTTTDVVIDMADLGSNAKSYRNIIDLINQKLDDAGMATTFALTFKEVGEYTLEMRRSSAETIEFIPTTGQPSVYIAATSGTGDTSALALRRINDLASTPQVDFKKRFDVDAEKDGAINPQSSVTDSQGNLYVVGSTSGPVDGQNPLGPEDAILQKFDASGNLLWTQILGSADTSRGFSVAVDSQDNVIIAGTTEDRLTETAYGGGTDSFITKYSSAGEELWTRQAAPGTADGALAVTVGSNDEIYVAGYTNNALSGATHGGGKDAYLQRLDSSGNLLGNVQFGDTGSEEATAIGFSGGNVYIAGNDDGKGFIRRYDGTTLAIDSSFSIDLGAAGENTTISALSFDVSGNLYVAGSTTDAALPASAGAAHQGGQDAYAAKIDTTTGTVSWTSYLGSSASDKARDIKVSGSDIYVSGETGGGILGTAMNGAYKDGFVSRLDATGSVQWTHQFSGAGGTASATSIAVDTDGSSILTALGLPRGEVKGLPSALVTANSSVRPGQYFFLGVNGRAATKININASDTFNELAFKINRALGTAGRAKMVFASGGRYQLKIEAVNKGEITLRPGSSGNDALAGLGLSAETIFGKPPKGVDTSEQDKKTFALNFFPGLSLSDKEKAQEAVAHIKAAEVLVKKAFKAYTNTEVDEEELKRQLEMLKAPPKYLAKQLASYQKALENLGGG